MSVLGTHQRFFFFVMFVSVRYRFFFRLCTAVLRSKFCFVSNLVLFVTDFFHLCIAVLRSNFCFVSNLVMFVTNFFRFCITNFCYSF